MVKYHGKERAALITILIIVLINSTSSVDEDNNYPIPKSEVVQAQRCDLSHRDVLLTSLMNGEVRALNLDNGIPLWSIRTGNKLLSSSISNLEVIYNGIPTRLVPSLDGSLFRFHDDNFEPLPFTAETLLSSSFKLPGDTMVGSKELITIGVDPSCGQVLYKCNKEGCDSNQQHEIEDVLVVKHMTHTVRAASIRNGAEKWNFSVGHHELSFSESDEPLYANGGADQCDSSNACAFPKLKFDVPRGTVIRVSDSNSSHILWEHKFSDPISKSWVLRNGKLDNLDLLDPEYIMIGEGVWAGESGADRDANVEPPPSMYIGVFEQQFYIQSSGELQKNMSVLAERYRRGYKTFTALPTVRWAPYIASTPSRTPSLNYGKADPTTSPPTTISNRQRSELSIIHPTMDYPYDQGFHLTTRIWSSNDRPRVDKGKDKSDELDEEEDDSVLDDLEKIMIVQIVSLQFYWKEVLVISVLSAVFLNGILYLTRAHRRRLKNKLKCLGSEDNLSDVSDISDVSGNQKKKKKLPKYVDHQPEAIPPVPPPVPQYHSRYQNDFIHLQCLGKGGFGVVFHAKNALDECEYAIKRITLPNSADAKEKVTREVKALAKLEHPNIVRYFQSWFETPPIGWQEDHDKIWESTERFMPTPVNSGHPVYSRQQSLLTSGGDEADEKTSQLFIPKFRLDESRDNSASFGFQADRRAEDSLDIVFGSGSGDAEVSVSGNQPFHKYAVAPAEHEDSSESESDDDWHHFDDSGYHKNKVSLVGTTGSFGIEESLDDNTELSTDQSHRPSISSSAVHSKQGNQPEPQAKLFLYIQMQLCKRETLREYLNANTLHRDKSEILLIFRQICDAVEYIHSQGLIHRDLKPTNIFFSAENIVKVGDFGLVTALSPFPDEKSEDHVEGQSPAELLNLTNNVGTQIYMSPEQISRKQYNSKVDIYALGLVFFELKYPFSTMMERVISLQGIKRHKYPERFVRELPTECKFVKWMLARNPNKRPSISAVLQSGVMSGSDELLQASRIRTRTVSRSSSND